MGATKETDLYYFGARYYDPRTSVWQSTDPALGAPDHRLGDSFVLVAYGYANQNPIAFTDPDGRNPYLILVATGLIVGSASSSGRKDLEDPQSAAMGATLLAGAGLVRYGATMARLTPKPPPPPPAVQAGATAGAAAAAKGKDTPVARDAQRQAAQAAKQMVESVAKPGGVPPVAPRGFKFTTEIAEQGAKVVNVQTPAGKTLQVAFEEVREGTTLILRGTHIQGAKPGEIGVSALKEMVRQYGREQGASKVIVEGARRTTSSMAGKTPRPWVIDVK